MDACTCTSESHMYSMCVSGDYNICAELRCLYDHLEITVPYMVVQYVLFLLNWNQTLAQCEYGYDGCYL